MNVFILPSAEQDLDSGYHFYENQQEGLGGYFEDTLFSDIESLKLHAGIHLKVSDYYRCVSKRFPFAIYYKVNPSGIFVFAVLDCRRDPDLLGERLK